MLGGTSIVSLFPALGRRHTDVRFEGGGITSDGALFLLGQADRKLGLLQRIAPLLPDHRGPERVEHSALDSLRQRVYEIVQGHEDLNDQGRRRLDPVLQTALNRDTAAASAPILCRFERRATLDLRWKIQAEFVRWFIASLAKPPQELILDFDATDVPRHGEQEARLFHGYYDTHCYWPLYVCSAVNSCWWLICGPANSTLPSMRRRPEVAGGTTACAVV